ncbi:uncharacterized protein LOC115766786 [Drosophila novamexicana]|uniref:uncharacterized protein LOC115766786 n=1 Tax=Drosophila novamexicana TaxID=47314 RepID=UPI0011E5C25A|nr:uncharacterized protein LOC115766786 [Drosophila novamexicana]
MSHKWYRLSISGSFANPQNYVNILSSARLSSITPTQTPKYIPVTGSVSDLSLSTLSRMSLLGKLSAKKLVKKQTPKVPRTRQKRNESCVAQCQQGQCTAEESQLIRNFIREVRYRELRQYYAKMIAAERSWPSYIPISCMCSGCGLPKFKVPAKDIRHNVYCCGPETMC